MIYALTVLLIAICIVVPIAYLVICAVCACMLSSQISQERGE